MHLASPQIPLISLVRVRFVALRPPGNVRELHSASTMRLNPRLNAKFRRVCPLVLQCQQPMRVTVPTT